jgi:hypothetical protein
VGKVKDACDGVDFDSKSTSAIDWIIKSIEKLRNKKKLKEAVNENKYMDFIISVLQYFVPWLALFVISLVLA